MRTLRRRRRSSVSNRRTALATAAAIKSKPVRPKPTAKGIVAIPYGPGKVGVAAGWAGVGEDVHNYRRGR